MRHLLVVIGLGVRITAPSFEWSIDLMHNAATVSTLQSRGIAVITGNAAAQAEIRKSLGNAFDLRPLDSWAQLAPLLADASVEGVLLDLDTLGMPPAKTLELLANTRRMDQDLVLIAF